MSNLIHLEALSGWESYVDSVTQLAEERHNGMSIPELAKKHGCGTMQIEAMLDNYYDNFLNTSLVLEENDKEIRIFKQDGRLTCEIYKKELKS